MKRVLTLLVALSALLAPSDAHAQEVFHSIQSINLPTAETLPSGSWLFEISHRFNLPVSEGAEDFWGLDGGAQMRLGLVYAATGSLMFGVERANFEDNLELNAKLSVLEGGSAALPLEVALMGGVAWNTQPGLIAGAEDNEAQLYAQLIANAMLGGRVAVGVVPTYLRNPRIRDFEAANAFTVGLNGQVYLYDWMSVLGEWIVSESRQGQENDGAAFGVEFETRGHFFKLVFTNQTRLNPTQVLGGTAIPFEPDEWRFGFNITRILPFRF